jgi:hypothetical protein
MNTDTTHSVCYDKRMPTTRQRVNLTLSELEQRFLEAIVTESTAEHDFYVPYLESTYGLPSRSLADIVHVVLKLGIDRLEHEAAEISYAAEAAAETDEDRALSAARRRRFVEIATRDDG